MKTATLLVLALILLALAPAQAHARDAFNGTWKAILTPTDENGPTNAKEIKDTLTFKGSQFKSATFEKKGFAAEAYEEDTRGGIAATFKCKVKSEKEEEGTAVWTGTSTGVELSGELTITKPDGTEIKYVVKASKQQ